MDIEAFHCGSRGNSSTRGAEAKSNLDFLLQGRQNSLWRKRPFTHSHADGVINRVGDACGGWDGGALAGAEGVHVEAVDEHDVELGKIREAHDRIALPVQAGDATGGVE